MVDWEKIRADFPVTRDKAYFISAGLSPLPNQVLARINREYKQLNEWGDIFWYENIEHNAELRRKIGKLINTTGDNLTFVQSTSLAMSLMALSLKGQVEGESNVVSMLDEFPSTTVPFEYQNIRMKYVKPVGARYPLDEILDQVDDETLAVLTSYVQYSTGFRQDLEKLGAELKRCGKMLIVNATQGFPFFPLDVGRMNIDAFSASLHKWGFAGYTGALFYTSPEYRRRFRPPIAGWLSVIPDEGDFIYTKKNHPLKLRDSSDQYLFGSINLQAVNSFETALDYLNDIGFDNIRRRIFELADYLIDGLKGLKIRIVSPVETGDERSAIVAFSLDGKAPNCLSYLEKHNVYVSLRGGNLRVALNIFNNYEDIDRLFTSLKNYL